MDGLAAVCLAVKVGFAKKRDGYLGAKVHRMDDHATFVNVSKPSQ
jgi:hypothetical protein